jgi:hypothetical protein
LLPAASCSLYVFPQIKAENGDPTIPSAAGVQLLQDMILWLAAEASALDAFDAVGAHPTHALMVANTEDSLSLAMAIYERVPEMLTRVHAAAPRPFEGESALHIAAVNRREPQLIRMVELAATHADVWWHSTCIRLLLWHEACSEGDAADRARLVEQ